MRDTLQPVPIDPRFGVQVVCLRPRVAHPQLLATSRHVTCGGPDLRDVSWQDNALSGVSELVAADPYVLYLNEPAGSRFDRVDATGARVVSQVASGSAADHPAGKCAGRGGAVDGAVPNLATGGPAHLPLRVRCRSSSIQFTTMINCRSCSTGRIMTKLFPSGATS